MLIYNDVFSLAVLILLVLNIYMFKKIPLWTPGIIVIIISILIIALPYVHSS